MNGFIGTKMVQAEEQEQNGAPGYRVVYDTGYESWSPKDVFETSYRLCSGMNAGLAMEAAKMGFDVRKKSWPDAETFIRQVNRPEMPYLALFVRGIQGTIVEAFEFNMPSADFYQDDWEIVTIVE